MTDLADSGTARPSFLDSLGARGARRAEPRASIALAGAGCFLAMVGVLILAGDAGIPDGSGSFNRVPGILLGALLVGAGLLTLQSRPRGPVATAGAVALAVGVPTTVGFLLIGGSDGRIDAVLGLSTLAWAAAYLTGPAKGRPVFLGLTLYGAWSTVMQVVGTGFSYGMALSPVGLVGGGEECYYDSSSGMSTCDDGGFGGLGGMGGMGGFDTGSGFSGPDFATIGAVSIGIALAYFLLSRHLDRRGRRGMSTPFVVVGLLAFVQGVISMAIELGLRPGGGLVIVAGIGLAVFGGHLGRRFTTWLGALGTIAGVAMVLLPEVDSAVTGGFILIGGGLAVVAVGYILAVQLDEPDELDGPTGGNDPVDPVPARRHLTAEPTAAEPTLIDAPLLELVPLEPAPVKRTPATRPAVVPPPPRASTPAKRAPAKRVAPKKATPKKAAVAKKATPAKTPVKKAAAKKAATKRA